MKLCVCKLDDTLSQNAKDGGCRSVDGFIKKKKKITKKTKHFFYKDNVGGIKSSGP